MDKQIVNTLTRVHDLLAEINEPWLVIGTSSLMLNGFDVKPHDIDILTDTPTAFAIQKILKPYQVPVQLKDEGKFRSAFCRYVIGQVSVEVMGGLEVNTKAGWVLLSDVIVQPLNVTIEQKNFRIPSNTDQLTIYSLFNRVKDERIISELLKLVS